MVIFVTLAVTQDFKHKSLRIFCPPFICSRGMDNSFQCFTQWIFAHYLKFFSKLFLYRMRYVKTCSKSNYRKIQYKSSIGLQLVYSDILRYSNAIVLLLTYTYIGMRFARCTNVIQAMKRTHRLYCCVFVSWTYLIYLDTRSQYRHI